ncbi:MAG: phosphomannomutase/phosphoglucomutase [Clostridia bacterium]|nr:phosphomannomutase/phosphoglucomutase [Clostridia bacterium]
MSSWQKLKSGSDVRGVAVGEHPALTPHIAKCLGMAFARFTASSVGKPVSQVTIAIGRDSRVTGPTLADAAAEGISRAGASVLHFGLCTTPAMYMSIITPGFAPDGAIMITASHLPPERNGLKFFLEEGGLEEKDVVELLDTASELEPDDFPISGKIAEKPFLPVYMDQLADRIRKGLDTDMEKPLLGLHVLVDAGNGAGGFYAELMERLGAWIEGSQFLEPDGNFPNHMPNPENPEAMKSVSEAVLRAGADLGVIFDADCDRAAIVDCDGREINRNRLIALISAMLLDEEPGVTIVTDSVTSSGLRKFIGDWGGEHYRYKRGYRNVIDEARRLNAEGINCPLAIETSGHAALRENHFLDDGMYLVTVLIVKAMKLKQQGKTLGSLIADLQEPKESAEIRLQITEEDFRTAGQKAIALVMEYANAAEKWHIASDNREGVRISFDLGDGLDNGWFLLRLSVHDPVLPLNVESDIEGGVQSMLSALYEVLKDAQGIDLAPLKKAAQG